MEASQIQTHEKRERFLKTDIKENVNQSPCLEDESSDLDEMTAEANQQRVVDTKSPINEHSNCSSLFSTPALRRNAPKAQKQQHCYLNGESGKVQSESLGQVSAKDDPMESPSIVLPVRVLSICHLREIANSHLNLVKNFVKKDVILTKQKSKIRVHTEHLAVCRRINTRPSNYRFNRKIKSRVVRPQIYSGLSNYKRSNFANARASNYDARPTAFISESQAMQSNRFECWQTRPYNTSYYDDNYC